MKPSELFGVVVRATGFLIVLYSLWNLWAGCENILESILSLNESSEADLPSVFYYFAFGVPGLVLGAVCFFLANWVVKLAYRDGSR
jgi:hypothetical protein